MSAGRNRREGVLHIDGVEVGITTAPGNAYSLNVKKPYYFGGINQTESEDVLEKAVKNLAVRLREHINLCFYIIFISQNITCKDRRIDVGVKSVVLILNIAYPYL